MFQRECFKYLAARLPSIRRLVARIGRKALEDYCCKGFFTADCIADIRLATALLASAPAGEDEDEDEDENEVGDEEHEDEDADEVMGY